MDQIIVNWNLLQFYLLRYAAPANVVTIFDAKQFTRNIFFRFESSVDPEQLFYYKAS